MSSPGLMPRSAPNLVAARWDAEEQRRLAAAIARDSVLTPEEEAARSARSAHAAPAAPQLAEAEAPAVRLRPYQSLLHRTGWRVEFMEGDPRARIEAFHDSGAIVMVTCTRGSGYGVRTYVLNAGGKRRTPAWRGVTPAGFEYFAHHQRLMSGTFRPLSSKCACKKRAFPSRARAQKALLEIKLNKELRRRRTAKECRVYRCDADDRVWHITSRKTWRAQPPQAADGR